MSIIYLIFLNTGALICAYMEVPPLYAYIIGFAVALYLARMEDNYLEVLREQQEDEKDESI